MALSEYQYITVKYVDGVAVVNFRETMAMFEGEKVQAVGMELIDLVESRKEPKVLLNLSQLRTSSPAPCSRTW